ncbi:MAG: hypothetical protein P4L64_05660 [Caulobacteraceae bacterium]|nr:hypothetical protein [Caulobacteraceae bacterium]
MSLTPDPELEAAAAEELTAALGLTWRELSRLIPWGDTFEGIGPGGGDLYLERSYLWAVAPGGDILCEVTAYRGASRYDAGVKLSGLIRKPA